MDIQQGADNGGNPANSLLLYCQYDISQRQ
jgi:hypothetical protein